MDRQGRRRGITEKTFYLVNPLPKTDEATLLNDAGLTLVAPSNRDPFEMDFKYGGGLQAEFIRLHPGDRVVLRESEVREAMLSLKDLGAVAVPIDATEEEIEAGGIPGLRTAVEFYRSRGKRRLVELKKLHGFSDDEMETHKYDHWSFYLNEAKSKVVEKELERVIRRSRESARDSRAAAAKKE